MIVYKYSFDKAENTLERGWASIFLLFFYYLFGHLYMVISSRFSLSWLW